MPGLVKALLASSTPNFNVSGLVPDELFVPSTYSGNGGSLTVTNNLNLANELAERFQYYGNFSSGASGQFGTYVLPGINNTTYLVTAGPQTSIGAGESDEVTIFISAFSDSVNEAETILWARQIKLNIPGGNTSGGMTCLTATVDNQGNLFIATGTSYGTGSSNNTWLVKYSPNGLMQWQIEIFDQNLIITSLTCDTAGNVYAAVPTHSTSFDGVVILKYSNSGTLLDTFNLSFTYTVGNISNTINNNPGGTTTAPALINVALDIDPSTGNIWASFYTGSFSGDIPLGTAGYGLTFGYAILSSAGAVLENKLFPAPITNSANGDLPGTTAQSISVDSTGNAYIYIYSPPAGEGYIIKVSPVGAIVWAFSFAAVTNEVLTIQAVTTDVAGNIYLGALGNNLSSYIVKLNPAGTVLWQAKINNFLISTVQLDTEGNVYLGGFIISGVTVGSNSTTTETYGYIFFTPTGAFLGSPSTIDTFALNVAYSSNNGVASGTAPLTTVTPSTFTSTSISVTTGGLTTANSTLDEEMALDLTNGSLTDSANTSIVNWFSPGSNINDTGFMIWIMDRTTGNSAIFDTVRGLVNPSNPTLAEYLRTTTTTGQISASGTGITNPSTSGFGIGNLPAINTNGDNYIAWTFLAQQKFFDIVTYQGNGGTQVVPHQLGTNPALIILTSSSGSSGSFTGPTNWIVWLNSALGYLFLNKPNSSPNPNQAEYFGNNGATVLPGASSFTVGASEDVNGSPFEYVAYLFADTPGVSKVGTYVGNGTQQAIDCEFNSSARFVLIGSQTGWYIFDTARGIHGPAGGNFTPYLEASAVVAEVTNDDSLFPSANGFAVQQGSAVINTSGVTYAFFALA